MFRELYFFCNVLKLFYLNFEWTCLCHALTHPLILFCIIINNIKNGRGALNRLKREQTLWVSFLKVLEPLPSKICKLWFLLQLLSWISIGNRSLQFEFDLTLPWVEPRRTKEIFCLRKKYLPASCVMKALFSNLGLSESWLRYKF